MSERKPKYETLGDIAAELRVMKADGMTLESVRYVIDQVFGDQIAEAERRARVIADLSAMSARALVELATVMPSTPRCRSCGGALKPYGADWMHADHEDWKSSPHRPVLDSAPEADS